MSDSPGFPKLSLRGTTSPAEGAPEYTGRSPRPDSANPSDSLLVASPPPTDTRPITSPPPPGTEHLNMSQVPDFSSFGGSSSPSKTPPPMVQKVKPYSPPKPPQGAQQAPPSLLEPISGPSQGFGGGNAQFEIEMSGPSRLPTTVAISPSHALRPKPSPPRPSPSRPSPTRRSPGNPGTDSSGSSGDVELSSLKRTPQHGNGVATKLTFTSTHKVSTQTPVDVRIVFERSGKHTLKLFLSGGGNSLAGAIDTARFIYAFTFISAQTGMSNTAFFRSALQLACDLLIKSDVYGDSAKYSQALSDLEKFRRLQLAARARLLKKTLIQAILFATATGTSIALPIPSELKKSIWTFATSYVPGLPALNLMTMTQELFNSTGDSKWNILMNTWNVAFIVGSSFFFNAFLPEYSTGLSFSLSAWLTVPLLQWILKKDARYVPLHLKQFSFSPSTDIKAGIAELWESGKPNFLQIGLMSFSSLMLALSYLYPSGAAYATTLLAQLFVASNAIQIGIIHLVCSIQIGAPFGDARLCAMKEIIQNNPICSNYLSAPCDLIFDNIQTEIKKSITQSSLSALIVPSIFTILAYKADDQMLELLMTKEQEDENLTDAIEYFHAARLFVSIAMFTSSLLIYLNTAGRKIDADNEKDSYAQAAVTGICALLTLCIIPMSHDTTSYALLWLLSTTLPNVINFIGQSARTGVTHRPQLSIITAAQHQLNELAKGDGSRLEEFKSNHNLTAESGATAPERSGATEAKEGDYNGWYNDEEGGVVAKTGQSPPFAAHAGQSPFQVPQKLRLSSAQPPKPSDA